MNKRLSQIQSALPPLSQRKGSHVGVIISFAVFIVFLVFLFVILEPSITTDEGEEATLDNMGGLLTQYLGLELTIATVRINQNVNINGADCVNFKTLDSINVAGLTGSNIFVKNSAGTKLESDWRLKPDLRTENDGSNRFFKIYASSGISSTESTLNGCRNIATGEYTLGITKTEEKIFERDIINAIELYKTDYTLFKQNVGISTGEFSFDFTYNNGTILSTGESSGNKNVYAKEIPINYLDTSLNSNTGSITIKTW